MPSLATIRASNAAISPSYTPIAIFVGGTAGIGQGIAEAFARHTNGNAHLIIIGRNQAAADSILTQFPKPSAESSAVTPTHEFVQCDVTLMKNVHAVTKELLTRLPKINFLVMTPGYITTKGWEETEDGVDRKLAVHYYSRWKFISDLLPALKRAKEAGEHAKVLSVLAAGMGGVIDTDDIGLRKTFSFLKARKQVPTYNDLMMEEYAARNPDLTFIHAFPGLVQTSIMSSSDSPIFRAASYVVMGLGYALGLASSYQDSGEYMLHGLLSSTNGAFQIGERGEDLKMKKFLGSEEARRKLWEHTEKVAHVE